MWERKEKIEGKSEGKEVKAGREEWSGLAVVKLGSGEDRKEIIRKKRKLKGDNIWIEDDMMKEAEQVKVWRDNYSGRKKRARVWIRENKAIIIEGWWFWNEEKKEVIRKGWGKKVEREKKKLRKGRMGVQRRIGKREEKLK